MSRMQYKHLYAEASYDIIYTTGPRGVRQVQLAIRILLTSLHVLYGVIIVYILSPPTKQYLQGNLFLVHYFLSSSVLKLLPQRSRVLQCTTGPGSSGSPVRYWPRVLRFSSALLAQGPQVLQCTTGPGSSGSPVHSLLAQGPQVLQCATGPGSSGFPVHYWPRVLRFSSALLAQGPQVLQCTHYWPRVLRFSSALLAQGPQVLQCTTGPGSSGSPVHSLLAQGPQVLQYTTGPGSSGSPVHYWPRVLQDHVPFSSIQHRGTDNTEEQSCSTLKSTTWSDITTCLYIPCFRNDTIYGLPMEVVHCVYLPHLTSVKDIYFSMCLTKALWQ